MNNNYGRSLSVLILLSVPLFSSEVPVVRGQVFSHGQDAYSGLFVSMEDVFTHAQVHRVDVTHGGSFEFRGVPIGEYMLRVTGLHGEAVLEQFVTIHEHMDEIHVSLPESTQPGNTKPAKVSMTQLLHPPDKNAVRAFRSALRLSESGKYDEAASALETAVRISPEFSEAYTNLAVQHVRLGKYELAATESQRAMQISGKDPVNLCNLAFAQFQLHQYREAEESSRAALTLDNGYLQGHLVLGSVLALDRSTWKEAIAHLQIAARQFASARKTLDSIRAMK